MSHPSLGAHTLALELHGVAVGITSSDPGVLEWLAELLDPWWQPSHRDPDWLLRVSASAVGYREAARRHPAGEPARPCFLFDQEVLALPTRTVGDRTEVHDAERSLCFSITDGVVDVVADPSTNRWRFPLVWILTEIAGARLRRGCLDLHAAAVVGPHGAIVVSGPKCAGKTTLALHLLGAGAQWVGNDRVLLDDARSPALVLGVPGAVKIRPDVARRYPALLAIAARGRPYLRSEAELDAAEAVGRPLIELDLAFTPAQVATRLAVGRVVDRVAAAPLGAYVFPEVRADVAGWEMETLTCGEIAHALADGLYGKGRPPAVTTPFEALAGGVHVPSARQIDAAARRAPGYRILLGRDAYDEPSLASTLLGPGLVR